MRRIFKAGSIQLDCNPGMVTENIENSLSWIDRAKDQGCSLAVLPELFNTGYDLSIIKETAYNMNEVVSLLSEAAKNRNMWIAGGILEIENDEYYNSLYVINPGGQIAAKYRKINLFTIGMETEIFTPGRKIQTFEINGLKAGLAICFDLRYPGLFREYRHAGCDAVIIVSAFPFPRLDHWRVLLKARAIENQLYIIASNRTGKEAGLEFLGNSMIIDPWGTALSAAGDDEETIVTADIFKSKVDETRDKIPCG